MQQKSHSATASKKNTHKNT